VDQATPRHPTIRLVAVRSTGTETPDRRIRNGGDLWRLREIVLDGGVDPVDPPLFETERAYLERLDLLTPGERRGGQCKKE